MFFSQSRDKQKSDIVPPKPKEQKPTFSLLSQGVMLPGAIIAGILIFIATGFGVFRLFSFSKKKKEKTKLTTLDK